MTRGSPLARAARDGAVAVRAVVGLAWVVLAFVAPWHLAAEGRSTPVATVLIAWGWLGWTMVAVALLVPLPASLTMSRCVMPLAVVIAIAAGSPLALAASSLALLASSLPVFTDSMVQGGAYGRETRFSLRTPVPQIAPALVAWVVLVVTVIGGSLLVAAGRFLVGAPLLVGGCVLATRTPLLLHRLSRRWLVIVPAGAVVHDHVVLAETFMVRAPRLAAVSVVRTPGEAADLTGGVPGARVLVSMREADKVVLSPIAARTLGTTEALHVRSFTIAPRRPAAAAAALTTRS